MGTTSRNALVTGGTKGIGRATALALAALGHRVTCVFRGDVKGKEACAKAAQERGLTLEFEQADVSVAAEVSALFDRLAKADREPDLLVNAAGMTKDAPFAFTPLADFEAVLAGNLKSTFLVCQQAVKPMVRRRFGRIVNFTSPAALIGNEGQAAYSAAKAGVIGLTRTLAKELSRYQITVNAVSPGLVPTELSQGLDEEKLKRIIQRTPLGRTGKPEEVAGAVLMLCDDLAGYITGQVIAVDGGLT